MSIELVSLPDSYVLEMSKQFSFLGAFMGGFAATIFATLLGLDSSKRIVNWTVCLTAISACSFIIAVIGSVTLSFALHPDAPRVVVSSSYVHVAKNASLFGFGLGVLALLASIGVGGWIRSRIIGVVTSVMSILTLVLIVWVT